MRAGTFSTTAATPPPFPAALSRACGTASLTGNEITAATATATA